MNGYFLIKSTYNNNSGMCGILTFAIYPTDEWFYIKFNLIKTIN
jgi:hypothetical protein